MLEHRRPSPRSALRSTLAITVVALLTAACSPATPAESPSPGPDRTVGGACSYADIGGTCTIGALVDAPVGEFRCEGGSPSKKVPFRFAATDPSAKLEYGGPDPAQDTLTVGGGMHPSAGWLEANGVKEGASFACTRKHITSGTCSPVVWTFPTLKVDDQPCR